MSSRYGRTPLPAQDILRIRRERAAPRLMDFHYLHLRGLRDGLITALSQRSLDASRTLDVYCGTQPYRGLLRAGVVGLDIDSYFGSAEVVADGALPFADESFSLVLNTQALYFIEDDAALVSEMHRVLRKGGHAIVTVPYLFLKSKTGTQRRYRLDEFSALFSGWGSMDLQLVGGLGTGLSYLTGSLLQSVSRRVGWLRPISAVLAACVNAFGFTLDWATRPLIRRWPATLVAVARR